VSATTRRDVGSRVTGLPRSQAGRADGGEVVGGGVVLDAVGVADVGGAVGRVGVVVGRADVGETAGVVGDAVGSADDDGCVRGWLCAPQAANATTHPIAAKARRPFIADRPSSRRSV
jgi:hypothetical protein